MDQHETGLSTTVTGTPWSDCHISTILTLTTRIVQDFSKHETEYNKGPALEIIKGTFNLKLCELSCNHQPL